MRTYRVRRPWKELRSHIERSRKFSQSCHHVKTQQVPGGSRKPTLGSDWMPLLMSWISLSWTKKWISVVLSWSFLWQPQGKAGPQRTFQNPCSHEKLGSIHSFRALVFIAPSSFFHEHVECAFWEEEEIGWGGLSLCEGLSTLTGGDWLGRTLPLWRIVHPAKGPEVIEVQYQGCW